MNHPARRRMVVPMRKRFYLGLIVLAILVLALGGFLVRSAAAGVRVASGG